MRFLIVAERELRAASRRKATYHVRWLSGTGFFILLVWLMWAMDAFTRRGGAHDVFTAFSVIVLFYCLFIGAIRTADCISSERREGTLGLLFLTNLNSAEIILGKLLSNAVPSVYGLVSIFPMLAIPLLMGGVTAAEFLRTMLALATGILFSLGCGFISTVVCRRHFTAVSMALGLVLALGTLTFAAAGIIDEYKGPYWLVHGLCSISPLYAIVAALESRIMGANYFWLAVSNVAVLSLLLLGLTTLLLAHSWRDRAKARRKSPVTGTPQSEKRSKRQSRRAAFNKRLLKINPFYWLASRRHVSSPVFMTIVGVLVLITVFGTTPLFSRISSPARYQHVLGAMIAWLCTGIALHILTLYYAAMVGSQSVAEDKHTGAMELIFSTPVTIQTILKGLGAAFRRRMVFPAIATTMAHCYFFWLAMRMTVLDPPGISRNITLTTWEMLWVTLLNLPVRGRMLEWDFVMVMRTVALVLPLAFVLWFTLARVGRWLGLRMKHPGFAPMVALALLIVPPTLVYSVGCYIADQAHVYKYSDRILMPIFIGSAFGILLLHCAIIGGWAARNLRENFRPSVIGQPDKIRRTWNQRGTSLLKFTLKTTGVLIAVSLLILSSYAYQNHRSRKAWDKFQAEIQQKNISLSVASLLSTAPPDDQNFARSKGYQSVLRERKTLLAQYLSKSPSIEWAIDGWRKQEYAQLANFADYLDLVKDSQRSAPPSYTYNLSAPRIPPDSFDGPTNNAELAPLVLKQLEPLKPELEQLAADACKPVFWTEANLTAMKVLQANPRDLHPFRELHLTYTLRSLASLETDQPDAAANDILTSLRLARLAGQLPIPRAAAESQLMMISSLQPLWEGLDRHTWNEPQLAALQSELASVNPVANFTNCLELIVRANIEIWRSMPNEPSGQWRLPSPNNSFRSSGNWRGVHRDWWLDCCVLIYRLKEDIVKNLAHDGERIHSDLDWASINNFPLDNECQQVFQRMMQYYARSADAKSVAAGQTLRNQALIAIALERYRVRSGKYPAQLTALTPDILVRIPFDVEAGRMMLYEPLANGSYLLRGLGRVDQRNATNDDKLWAYPTNSPSLDPEP